MSLTPISPRFESVRLSRRGIAVGVVGAVLFVGAMPACSVDLLSDVPSDVSQNTCESKSDCGFSDLATCDAGECRAGRSVFDSYLLEIIPPTGTTSADGRFSIGGLRFLQIVDEPTLRDSARKIDTGYVSHMVGAVRLPELSGARCVPVAEGEGTGYGPSTDESVAARVTLTPRSRLLGLPTPTTTEESLEPGEDGYRVEMTITPGRYDVYVEPFGDDDCIHPPLLILDEEFAPGDLTWDLELPPPEHLGVTIRFPGTGDLEGWTLDLIQKDSGRLLSNRAVLGAGQIVEEEGSNFSEYRVELAFSSVEGEDGGDQLVRLSPPEGAAAPIVYLERSVVDLFQDETGLVDQLTDLPTPVDFSGRVTTGNAGGAATVTLIATTLDATNEGTVSSFSRTVETDEDGDFTAQLLPGEYRVLIEPTDAAYALLAAEVTVSAAPVQSGRTFPLILRHEVSGVVVGFTGQRISGAPMWANAAPSNENVSILNQAQGAIQRSPVALGSTTNVDGDFQLIAETGTYSLSARPEPSTGFAWGLRLGVEINSERTDVGQVELPLPFPLSGTLESGDVGRIPDALIRAYARMTDEGPAAIDDDADFVIPIAESRVDEQGGFRLLIPSAFVDHSSFK